MLGRFRTKFQKICIPIGKYFSILSFSPNTLTILSLLAGIGVMLWFKEKNLLMGISFILLVGFFDIADGSVARYTKKETKFGGVLDHVVDRYAEFFIIMGIVLGGYIPWVWGFASLFGIVMASYTRAKAESIGGLKDCTIGIAERQEKIILILFGSLLQFYFENALLYAIIIVTIVSHFTVIQRLIYTKRIIENK